MNENVDRRVLGAFRCVDAITGNFLVNPLPVTTVWTVKPNQSGIYVIFNGPGYSKQTTEFDPSTSSAPWPPKVPFEVTIQDPNFRYLPRRAQVNAFQKLTPPTDSDSVFNPQEVSLYPTSASPVAPSWAVIYASVVVSGNISPGAPRWAVLQITRNSDGKVMATGAADDRGEALLAVTGLKAQNGTSVTPATIAATVQAWYDPSVSTQPEGWVPNPDDMLNKRATLKASVAQTVQLTPGQRVSMSFSISV